MNFREGNKEVPVGSLLHSPVTPWATNETDPLKALPHSGQWSLVPEDFPEASFWHSPFRRQVWPRLTASVIPVKTGSAQSTSRPHAHLDTRIQKPVLSHPIEMHVNHICNFKASSNHIKKINIKINFDNLFYVTQYYFGVSMTPNIIIST